MNIKHGITDTGKLKTIDIDKYEPIPDKPGRCRAVGQASKQEIFDQLKDHLEYVGMLPDEYFFRRSSPKSFRKTGRISPAMFHMAAARVSTLISPSIPQADPRVSLQAKPSAKMLRAS